MTISSLPRVAPRWLLLLAATAASALGADLAITAFPAAGALTAVSGKVTNLPAAATGYKAACYIQVANTWYVRVQPPRPAAPAAAARAG
ncbi:hypothetical protein EON68_04705 [archaeon]|nr:MAG: hypothetical protein EON68_04705 [archaeon]